MEFGIVLDRDDEGLARRTPQGDYRFTLRLKNGDETLVSIAGFRFLSKLKKIVPPVVPTRYTTISIIEIERKLELQIRDRVEIAVDKAEAERAGIV